MNRLKILHIFSGDLWAGAEVMIFNLLRTLKNYPQLEVIVLSLNEGILTEKLRKEGIEVDVIPESRHSFPGIVIKTLKKFRGRGIEVIHSHRYKENLLAFVIGKILGARRLISTIHGLGDMQIMKGKRNRVLGFKTQLNFYLLNSHFSYVVAVSDEMKRNLAQDYGFREGRIKVIRNGIPIPSDEAEYPNASNNDSFHIGSVGRLFSVKNFSLFLKVAAELQKHHENIRFSILGDGPLKKKLAREARDLKIANFDFLPPCPDPAPYYKSLDVYLNTSLSEGIPISVLEAMSFGKPVVASKVGGIPEIISNDENGFLVDNLESKTFAELILRLIENKELRSRIGIRAKERISSTFCVSLMAELYQSLYDS